MLLALEVLVAVVIVAMAFLFTRNRLPEEELWPFVPRPLLTAQERVLFRQLVEALPKRHVFAHVPLSQVLDVKTGVPAQEWMNLLSQKTVDFLVCSEDSTIVGAIGLDDGSPKTSVHRQANEVRDKALTDAGVKVLRWATSALPDRNAIREAFAS